MPPTYDIIVIGAGPVGLMFTSCLTRLGHYKILHIDKRPSPTPIGRGDGLQARTMDVLEEMALKQPIMDYDPGLIYEVAFWRSSVDDETLRRTGTAKAYPGYVDTRTPYTVILHQGKVEGAYLADLEGRGVEVRRSVELRDCRYNGVDGEYPVDVDVADVLGSGGEQGRGDVTTVRAKYVFGADGGKGVIRKILEIPMIHKHPITHVWGVIDGVVRSDFPDIGLKCTVRSSRGSAMVIPQGDNRLRIYVSLSPQKGESLRVTGSLENIQTRARGVLAPYAVEWDEVDWYSAYYIAQGIAAKYSYGDHIFIGGDACHTHSPKAGQGMNYGIMDAHNLAWKLHLVESGLMKKELLRTYNEERRAVAKRLIEFDAAYAGLFSSGDLSEQANAQFQHIFRENIRLTSGYGAQYPINSLNLAPTTSMRSSDPETPLYPGRCFPLANAIRVVDSYEVALERDIPFNGSFRIYIFAGTLASNTALTDLARYITRAGSVFMKYGGPPNLSYEARHNPHSSLFTFSVIINARRAAIEINDLPGYFASYRYHIYADETRSPTGGADVLGAAHRKMGFDENHGGVVVVRPDGFTGAVFALTEGRKTADELGRYFSGIVPASVQGLLSTRSML